MDIALDSNDVAALMQRVGDSIWKSMQDNGSPDEKEPRCCVCSTRHGLRNDGWYGYRCDSDECVAY